VVVFTTLRVSFATQIVVDPGSPSAETISTFQDSKVPAGTVTFSAPATFACLSCTFCCLTSKLRKVVL